MEISRNAKISKTAHALVQELVHEAVLLNVETNQYYRLNEDSLRMFTVLTNSATAGEAHAVLAAEYDVQPEELWGDLAAFIDELQKCGLIAVLDEPLG